MGANKEKKFQFVSLEEIENIDDINVVDSPKEVSVGNSEKVVKKRIRFYFGYEARILLSIIISIVLILISCFLISKTLNHKVSIQYPYDEESIVKYEVCDKNSICINENQDYVLDNINDIKVKYKYNLLFSKDINYDVSYSIIATTKIYDKNNVNRVYYKNEDILVPNKSIKTKDNSIVLDQDVDVVISKYKKIIENNKYRYNSEYDASLDISLYIYESNENRVVASIKLYPNNESSTVDVYNISNVDKFVELEKNKWDSYTIVIAIISTILILVALTIIYRATRLVLKTFSNKSNYELLLDNILKNYDSIIVVARDGYETDVEREIIKVDSFEELVELKDKTNKPIIFSEINDVKCEFILETDKKVYKYILKEADVD